ncbi:HNH endonuclease signature motif containing protein [Microbacterium sp. LEMMJ01]|uniref:HNH endonuclease signature motif containing protein n=1 Tax=Microbacterium sp. LEMMJ01 TaxID=1978350 RepID=UPI000A1E9BB2|nr:HNH endonuclease signature motif containing protein [Microbacterium sp. LEMMJ01]OSP04965.1 HNH endonuclease [Microbacterium sp. LEMMJ01]
MTNQPTDPLSLEERRRVRDAWAETRRRIAALEAEAAELLVAQIAFHDEDVAAAPHHRDAIHRSMVAEYATAARLSTGTMEFAFADALALSTALPRVREAFHTGALSSAHVREVARASAVVAEAIRNRVVAPETMALFETAVLVVAEAETAARTRVHARRVASALVGETITERHRRAADERCVTVRSVDDGLAVLTAILPEWAAVAIADRLNQLTRTVIRGRDAGGATPPPTPTHDDLLTAQNVATDHSCDVPRSGTTISSADGGTFALDPEAESLPADTRTWSQVQADLLTDLLLTADPSAVEGEGLTGVRGRLQVTVAATTLAGLDDRPAELDGHGALHPDIARALAGRDGGWTRLFLDPHGQVIETDAYSPTESMRRLLRARDEHCRFPGCRQPVHRCDIDHTWDHAKGGPTRVDNLAHLCRGHHVLKHPDIPEPQRWTVRQRLGGVLEWRSPLGAVHTDHAPRRVAFV